MEFLQAIRKILPGRTTLSPPVSFRVDAVTGSARLVRGPHPNKGLRYWLARGLNAFSLKWAAVSIAVTGAFFFVFSLAAADTASYESALNRQVENGDWAGGIHSLFILRMAASPRPLEFLIMIVAAPMMWNAMPPRWRFVLFPIIAQMLYMILSQVAFLPLEFALMNMFSSAASSLRML